MSLLEIFLLLPLFHANTYGNVASNAAVLSIVRVAPKAGLQSLKSKNKKSVDACVPRVVVATPRFCKKYATLLPVYTRIIFYTSNMRRKVRKTIFI